jgi:DNA-binding transcriptional ArsR family regulator
VLDATFHALAEPRRRAILRELGDRELTAGQVAARFDVTRPAISQHLAVLRTAGLVEERRDGTRRWYRARRDGLVPLRDWVGSFWDARLDALRVAIDEDEKRHKESGHG